MNKDRIYINPVLPNGCLPPRIYIHPIPQQVTEGDDLVFKVVAFGSKLQYQWYKDNQSIEGAIYQDYFINNATLEDAGTYTVRVYNECGVVLSDDTSLIVNEGACIPPEIITNPVGASLVVGGSVAFSVVATGTHLFYQWRKNGVDISGETDDTYSISSVTTGNIGSYSVQVSNTCGLQNSTGAALAVNIPPVADAGSNQTITLPSSTGTLNASGSTDSDGTIVTYLWSKVSGPSGGTITNPNIANTNITGLTAGVYVFSVLVTDNLGATASDTVTITVNPAILMAYWLATSTDSFPTINGHTDPFTYTNSVNITHNSPISFPLSSADSNKYFIFKVPIGESVKTTFYNTTFVQGSIPGSVFYSPINIGQWTYYLPQDTLVYDPANPFILS